MKKFILTSFLILLITVDLSAFKKASTYINKTFYLTGKVGNYPVTMLLEVNPASNKLSGYYYYDRIEKKLPLNGTIKKNHIEMSEKDGKGVVTGRFTGTIDNNGNIEGSWYSAKNNELNFELTTSSYCTNLIEESYFMKGLLSKYPISMRLTLNNRNDSVTGYYQYDRIGKKILLDGTCTQSGNLKLKEYADTVNTGTFEGQFDDNYSIHGLWSSSQENKTFDFCVKNTTPQAAAVVINRFSIKDDQQEAGYIEFPDFYEKDYALYVIGNNNKISYTDKQNSSLEKLAKDYQVYLQKKDINDQILEGDDDYTPVDSSIWNFQKDCSIQILDNNLLAYHRHSHISYGDLYEPIFKDKGYTILLDSMRIASASSLFQNIEDQNLCRLEQETLKRDTGEANSEKIFNDGLKNGFDSFLSQAIWWLTNQGIECKYSHSPYAKGCMSPAYDIYFNKKDLLPFVKPKFRYLFQ